MIWRSRWTTDHRDRRMPRSAGLPRRRRTERCCCAASTPSTARRRLTVTLQPRGGYDQHAADGTAPPRRHLDRPVGTLHLRWSGAAQRPTLHGGDAPAPPSLDLAAGAAARPGPGTQRPTAARANPPTPNVPGGTPKRPGQRRCLRLDEWPGAARHPPQLRGTARADQRQRRHGRRRHHQPARTRRSRPQLRLPLRLDPRPVLRRAGRRRRRRLPAAGRAVGFVAERLLEHGPRLAPAYTTTGDAGPRPTPPRPARLPGRRRHHRQLGQPAVPTRRLRRSPAPVRRRRPPRPTRRRHWTRRRASPPTPSPTAGPNPTPASGKSTTAAWTHSRLTAAAGLRAIAAAHPTGDAGRRLARPRRPHHRRHRRPRPAPDGHWQRSPDDPALDAALLLPGLRGAVAADDPRTTATLHAYLRDLTRRRLRLPLPPRRPATRPRPKAPSCSAASSSPCPCTSRASAVQARAWFERTRAASGPRNCSARNTTPPSTRCAATSRKRSSTP